MKYTLYFLAFLLLLAYNSVFAQNEMEDVVYLKNGSILRGKIIERVENERLKVEITGHSVFAIQWNEIQEIKLENKIEEYRNYCPEGFMMQANFNIFAGNYNSQKQTNSGLDLLFGYQFKPRFSSSIGLGFEFMDTPYVPLLINLGYQLFNSRLSPIINLRYGKTFPVNKQADSYSYIPKGGWEIASTIGLRRNTGKKSSVSFEIGYMYQKSTFERSGWNNWNETYYQYREYNRLLMRISFTFN